MFSLEEFLLSVPSGVKEKYDFSKASYKGFVTPIEGIICLEHGVFRQYPSQIRKEDGAHCQSCGESKRLAGHEKIRVGKNKFLERCRSRHGEKYDYSRVELLNLRDRITIICPTHGPFEMAAPKHLYAGQGCKKCDDLKKGDRLKGRLHLTAAAKFRNFKSVYFDRANNRHGNTYDYGESIYRGARKPITIRCKKHGPFEINANKHLDGRGCPTCSHHASQWEKKITDWLDEKGIPHEKRDRKIIKPKELDIWLPQVKLGIEVHGLHWHTSDKVGDLHRVKHDLAKKAGIRLVQLFDDDIQNRWPAVTGRLQSMIGGQDRVAARKTEVKEISAAEARKFLDHHHLQGMGATTGMYYGLHHGSDLVAVMTFGLMRHNSTTVRDVPGHYELVRFAASKTVVGGFSKLLTNFIRQKKPTKIISFSDMMHSDGAVYEKNGFIASTTSRNQYWWVDTKKRRISRYMAQKHKLRDHPETKEFYKPELTERQICTAAGWLRLDGVGNQRWELDIS